MRHSNQDSILIALKTRLFAVADGMGGHAGGEIASQMCIDIFQKTFVEKINQEPNDPQKALFLALSDANLQIYQKALEEPELSGMGTTATCLYFQENRAYWAHVGDTRLYLIRRKFIYQLTNDHSLIEEKVKIGLLSNVEARNHKLRNVITRSIGYKAHEEIDFLSLEVLVGDYFIICSDGLHNKVADQEICSLVLKEGTDAAENLIEKANLRGGEDNISVIIIEVSEL